MKIVEKNGVISDERLADALKQTLDQMGKVRKVLLIPPDYTRIHSYGGKITTILYELMKDTCDISILPALGTHEPMSEQEWSVFFGNEVPYSLMIEHKWRDDVVKIGEIPQEFIEDVSEGIVKNPIDVEVNKHLLDGSFDHIFSIGQVVPHEVVGMANYSKNIFVGCGGYSMINQSHSLGAFYGMERLLGKDFSPVRKVFDYAEERFINHLPLTYILTVTTQNGEEADLRGLYIGRDRKLFEEAVALSQEKNITWLDRAPKKIVIYLDEREFKSMWLGNKAIYRTRMAIADGGELVVLAPAVRKCGEDSENDRLIKKYGYVGRLSVLKLIEENEDLRNNLSVAAHLIHGSSDDRFSVVYAAPKMSKAEVESVNFIYGDYDEIVKAYNSKTLTDGWNTVNGEEIYYISNPALGLWSAAVC